jgi:hypothetical protein
MEQDAVSRIPRVLLEQLQAYWDGKRAGRDIPTRADIDPVDIPRLLPYLVMVDVEYGPDGALADFRYRLWGQHIIDHNRRSLAGRRLSDLLSLNPHQQRFIALYTRVVQERRPIFDAVTYISISGVPNTVDMAIFPLAAAGGRVESLMVGAVYRDSPISFEPDPVP